MALTIQRKQNAHGQVDAVKMAFKGTREVYAQLPTDETLDMLENGMFFKYDRGAGTVNTTTATGDWLMMYDEEVLVEWNTPGHRQYRKDFVLRKDDFQGGKIYPRLVATTVGDHMITDQVVDGSYEKGDYLEVVVDPGSTVGGILTKTDSIQDKKEIWVVDVLTTLPDGTPALGLTKIQ